MIAQSLRLVSEGRHVSNPEPLLDSSCISNSDFDQSNHIVLHGAN